MSEVSRRLHEGDTATEFDFTFDVKMQRQCSLDSEEDAMG